MNEDYEYVLYIDEAGDDGLHSVRPTDPNGASEWLIIGGFLIRSKNEPETINWVNNIREKLAVRQSPILHYRNLSEKKRLQACKILTEFPAWGFAICSNKKNMKGYNNDKASNRNGKQWFYNYCVRLLIERVSDACLRDSITKFNNPRPIRVIFSQRGGHSYGQTKAYWELLKGQSRSGSLFLNKRIIRHEVLRYNLVDYAPHQKNAGLQLADIVASSFYQAADTGTKKHSPEPAISLKPIMARENGIIKDFGVCLQPTPPSKARLTGPQKVIFQHYGYEF